MRHTGGAQRPRAGAAGWRCPATQNRGVRPSPHQIRALEVAVRDGWCAGMQVLQGTGGQGRPAAWQGMGQGVPPLRIACLPAPAPLHPCNCPCNPLRTSMPFAASRRIARRRRQVSPAAAAGCCRASRSTSARLPRAQNSATRAGGTVQVPMSCTQCGCRRLNLRSEQGAGGGSARRQRAAACKHVVEHATPRPDAAPRPLHSLT